MHCEVFKDGEGKPVGFICGSTRSPRKVCNFCNRHWVAFLCDLPVSPHKSCDRGICEKCRVTVGGGKDYCPKHALEDEPAQQGSLFEVNP